MSLSWFKLFLCISLPSQKVSYAELGQQSILIPPLYMPMKTRIVTPVILSVSQLIDHFSSSDERTFTMRYSQNMQFYNGSGPMFLFLAGENCIESFLGFLYKGLMYDIASSTGAAMFILEHRYYGNSIPNGNLKILNLKYLSVKQALADIASFVQNRKSVDSGLGKVVVFGCSYTGSLAAWVRYIYPNVIDASVSSSGLFKIALDNYEYLEVLQKDLEPYADCSRTLQNAIKTLQRKFKTPSGFIEIARDFKTRLDGTLLATMIPFYKSLFFSKIIMLVSMMAQYDRQDNYRISEMCGNLTANSRQLSDYTRLAKYYSHISISSNFEGKLNTTMAQNSDVAWKYQVCSELGSFVSTSSSNEPFYTTVPILYWKQTCDVLFKPIANLSTEQGIKELNQIYGGTNINVTRVVFTFGTIDPWSSIGLTKDLNSEAPVLIITGSSHCAVMKPATHLNTKELATARTRITELVTKWVQQN